MKSTLLFFCLLAATQQLMAQNPAIVKAVGGTVLEPKDKDQNIWMNNQWNGKFFYQGTGANLPLCVTDGTTAGTLLVKTITADNFQFCIPAQDFIYIITERSSGTFPNLLNNVEIWKSDGTAAGTVLVKALTPFNAFSSTAGTRWTSDKNLKFNYSVVGNVMYFGGWEAASGIELWRTDGTDAGTYMVKDIKPGTGTCYPGSFCAIGGEVFFTAASVGFEMKLWKTDGTAAGTTQVAVPEPFFMTPYVGKVGNKMIFFANNTVAGIEPWVSDGTPAGTYMLADVNPGSANSTPGTEQNLHLRFNDKYCFWIANKTSGGRSLWRTDGTTAGTIQLTVDGTPAEDNYSGGGYSAIDNNGLWWIGGNEKLYFSNGTPMGTRRVASTLSNALYMTLYKNAAWFHARVGSVIDEEPWRSDGTTAGTARALNVQPGTLGCYPYGFFTVNNKLYFFSSYSGGRNLYQYTGDVTFNNSVTGGRWSDSLNWNSLIPPGITDTAYIPAGFTVNVNGRTATTGNLIMGSGSSVNLVSATDSLYINRSLQGTTATGNGIVVLRNFNGDTVKVQSAFTAGRLSVQGTASLTGNLTINDNLSLTGGARLLANNNSVTMAGAASTLTTAADGYVVTNGTGSLVMEAVGSGGRTGPVLYPVGTSTYYNPATLTNSGTADVLSVRVQQGISNLYSGDVPTGGSYTSGAVNATWFINEGTAGGSNITVDLQWSAAQELSGFDRSQSSVGHFTAGAWQLNTPGTATGADPYTWSGSGYTSFSPFGVLNSNRVLPIQRIALTVQKSSTGNRCVWNIIGDGGATLTLEKSTTGLAFTPAYHTTYAATGEWSDAPLAQGKIYYRLKAIERSGAVRYSNVVWVEATAITSVYPTLFTTSLHVQHNGTGKAVLRLTSSNGQMIIQQPLAMGTNTIPTDGLAKGVYFYQVMSSGQVSATGMVVKQ